MSKDEHARTYRELFDWQLAHDEGVEIARKSAASFRASLDGASHEQG